jgi:hypothetical protein
VHSRGEGVIDRLVRIHDLDGLALAHKAPDRR